MIKSKSVLYISYDGLLDPLGGSQILPYIFEIAAHPRSIHILSFEKFERKRKYFETLRKTLEGSAISWTPLSFTQSFGIVGKLWDLLRMHFWGFFIALFNKSAIIHARGLPAAQVGYFIKRILRTKLIFDFRGLWVDERCDKGSWDLSKLFHRMQFRYFKRVEQTLLRKSDQIVVLTNAVIKEVVRLGAGTEKKITVIPCCADFSHFKLADEVTRSAARKTLCIPNKALVLGFLGSVGKMYMTDRFFRLVDLAAKKNSNVHVLALTPDTDLFDSEMRRDLSFSLHNNHVHVFEASREEVPKLLPAVDLLVSFIMPTYARIGSSPTKIAESFASGIPVICNHGVGDISEIVPSMDAGIVLDANSDEALETLTGMLQKLKSKGGIRLRNVARPLVSLEFAAKQYKLVYSRMS